VYRLLIADDEALERDALKRVASERCPWIDVITLAASGREAVDLATEQPPEVALLDIKMPGLDGLGAARRIREIAPHCRIIFLTAFDFFEHAQEAIRIGASDFLVKPVEDEDLVSLLRHFRDVQSSESQRSRRQALEEAWYRQTASFVETDTVAGMVFGHLTAEQIRQRLPLFSVEAGRFRAAAVELDYSSYPMTVTTTDQRLALERRAARVFAGHLSREHWSLLASGGLSYLYLFLSTDKTARPPERGAGATRPGRDTDADGLEPLLQEAIGQLRLTHDIAARISISGEESRLDRLGRLFLEAKGALRRNPDTPVVSAPADADSDGPFPWEEERRLLHAVLDGNREQALRRLGELVSALTELFPSPNVVAAELSESLIYLRHVLGSVEATTTRVPPAPTLPHNNPHLLADASAYVGELAALRLGSGAVHTTQVVEAVSEIIRSRFSEDLSLDAVAQEVRISPFYLSRIFRQVTGASFIDYLTAIRIRKAKELLRDPQYSVKEVSTLVGYSDPSYFSRVFRRVEGLPPSRLRSKKLPT
jgi:two-component system response regulator YesN